MLRRLLERRDGGSFFGGLGLGWPTGQISSFTPERIPRNGELGAGVSPMLVTENTALAVSAVAACVSLIADSVSSLPIDAYRQRGKIREPVDPAPAIVRDTFGDGNPQNGFYQAVYSLLMRGNWYSWIDRADDGDPIMLGPPIHPNLVQVALDKDTGQIVYKVNREVVPTRNLLHVKAFSIPGMLVGLGPLDYARETLGLGLAQQEYANRFFTNDASSSLIIQIPQDKTKQQVQEIVEAWQAHHRGVFRAHTPGVLTGGATANAVSITPENAQFLESRRFQVAEIARLFRVPPHMIGDMERSTSWGTGLEYQGTSFIQYTLAAWITRLERAISSLMPGGVNAGQFARFNTDAVMRADSLARGQYYTMARNGGWLNVDEIRALEDLEPLPDGIGQDYLQPLNMLAVGPDAQNPAPATPVPAPPGGK